MLLGGADPFFSNGDAVVFATHARFASIVNVLLKERISDFGVQSFIRDVDIRCFVQI